MSNADIDCLLKSIDKDENSYLIDQTRSSIMKIKNDMLQKLQVKRETLKDLHKKLQQYRYVDDLSTIKYGGYIRWINLTTPDNIKLTTGGTVMDVKIYQKGCNILCRNNMKKMFEIKFDECMIFQKLTDQEEVLLDVLTYLEK